MKKLKNKSKSPMKITLFVMIFFMIIGFSSLSITRFITGGVNLGFNFDDVNIYIANLYSNSINRFNSISEDKKSFNIELQNGTNNVDIYVSNNSTQYDEYINFVCNESDLNGVSITPNEDNTNIAYSQVILKNTFVIENTGEIQTLNCRLENLEVESTTKVVEKKRVIFALDGFENETAFKYVDSMTYGDLPIIELDGYDFLGWYNGNDELVESTTEITNFSDEILYGKIEENTCPYETGQVWNFDYTGGEQTFTAPCDGTYKLETWGAQGGQVTSSGYAGVGGKGAYSSGNTFINKSVNLHIYVGGSGSNGNSNRGAVLISGGFNGGGSNASLDGMSPGGGGATDIRVTGGTWNNVNSLNSRIIVAGGGGGSGILNYGAPGGIGSGIYDTLYGGNGTQTNGGSAGTGYTHDSRSTAGGFGYGGNGGYYGVGAGGSGWYGGGGGAHITPNSSGGGGGGSSYVKGCSGCNTSYINYQGDFLFDNIIMKDGNSSFPNISNTGNEVGHTGNGYARITYLGKNIQ